MDLKVGTLTFDAKPIEVDDFPALLSSAVSRSQTKAVRNFYDCRDGGTFGKKKTLTIRGNVIIALYAVSREWPSGWLAKPFHDEIKDTDATTRALFSWLKTATGLDKGDALESALETMFGETPKLPVPYDDVVAAHPGYSLEMLTYVDYDFIVLSHHKMARFHKALMVVGIPAGTDTWVYYRGKCEEGSYRSFKKEKRSLFRGRFVKSKAPATPEETRMRVMVIDAEIEKIEEYQEQMRKKRAELEARKARLTGK